MAKKNTDKIVFDHIKVLDAGAKGVSVAKAPDGKVIFIPNVVPGESGKISRIFRTQNRTCLRTFWCLWRLQMAEYEIQPAIVLQTK